MIKTVFKCNLFVLEAVQIQHKMYVFLVAPQLLPKLDISGEWGEGMIVKWLFMGLKCTA